MDTKNEDVWKLIEQSLGCAGRLRILRILASEIAPSQTKYSLEKLSNLSPIYVRKHLKILLKTGWVKEHNFNPTVYTLNFDDPKAAILVDFFKKIKCLSVE